MHLDKSFLQVNRIGILGIFATIALITALMLATDYAIMPQPLEITVTNAVEEVRTDNGSVIIDSGMDRLIFLNKENNVVKLINSVKTSQSVAYYSTVSAGPDGFYVAEYSLYENSRYLKSETIKKYSFQGDYLGKVLNTEYSLGDDRTLQARFWDICFYDGQGFVTGADTMQHEIDVWSFPLEPQKNCGTTEPMLHFAAPANNKFIINALFIVSQPSKIVALTNTHTLYLLDWQQPQEPVPHYNGPIDYNMQEYPLTIDMDTDGQFNITTRCYSNGKTFAYSGNLALHQVAFWVACLYLIIFLLYCIAIILRKLYKAYNYVFLKRIIVAFTALVFCLGVTAFYSIHIMDDYKSDMDKALREGIYLLQCNSPNPLEKSLQESKLYHTQSEETTNQVLHILENATYDMHKINYDMNFGLIAFDEAKRPFWLQDSAGDVLLGVSSFSLPITYDELQEKNDVYVYNRDSTWGEYMIGLHPINDANGETLGAVACFMDTNNLALAVFYESTRLLLILLPASMLIGFLLVEGNATLQCILSYRQKKQESASHNEFLMARPAAFLLWMAGTASSVLFPIIVKELAIGMTDDASAYLVAGSMSLFFIGFLVGAPLFKWMNLHWPIRKLVLFSTSMMVISFTSMYFGCLFINLYIFLIGSFCLNVFFSFSNIYIDSLSYLAPNSEIRAACNRGVSIAHISGICVSTFITGALANYLGNAAIDVFGALMAALTIAILYWVVPADAIIGAKPSADKTKSSEPAASGFFQSISHIFKDNLSMGLIVLLMFPCMVIQVYKSYIFPLYAYDLGMDKSMISNIVAFSGALVFYSSPLVNSIEIRLGSLKVMLTSGLIIASTFMLFLLDGGAVWAIVVLIVSNFAFKTMEPSIFTYWQGRIMVSHINVNDSQIVYGTIIAALKTVRAPIVCACLQVFGQIFGCFIMGTYVMLSILAFSFLLKTKK